MPTHLAAAAVGTNTGRRVLTTAALAALLAITVTAFAITAMLGLNPSGGEASYRPSPAALADIPENYLQLYLDAAQTRGVDWAILAAIGSIESDHGRSTRPGVHAGVNFAGCCAGPMQFLITGPNDGTWGAYGVDANHDGRKDVYDPADAIPAAAGYLKANGAPSDYHQAIFAYNHAAWYVADVLANAAEYRGALQDAGGVSPDLLANTANASAVLRLADGARPRIILTALHRNDLSTGQIDTRVTSLLVAIARQHTITVTALKSDHSLYTASGNISNHSAGRAADIAIVDGEQCDSIAHGRTGRCWQLARQLAQITGPLHPTELIYGIDPDGPGPATAQGDHTDHLHLAWVT